MSVRHALSEFWDNGGQVVAASVATALLIGVRSTARDVKTDDVLVDKLVRDLRRWVVRRDDEFRIELVLVDAYARNPDLEGEFVDKLLALRAPVPDELRDHPAGSLYSTGARLNWRAQAAERALREYVDVASDAIDTYNNTVGREGVAHAVVRALRWRRRRRRLVLPEPARAAVRRWREPVSNDDGVRHVEVKDATADEPDVLALEAD